MPLSLPRIVVIGAGFSGTVTAVQLARQAHAAAQPVHITLLHPTPRIGRGLAYQFDNDNLLLNVPAGNMSALPEVPAHFVAYCQAIDPALSAQSFVPRRLYGCYVEDVLAQTQRAHPSWLHTQMGCAVEVRPGQGGSAWQVVLASGDVLAADHVVWAIGHQASTLPAVCAPLAPLPGAVLDPWDFAALARLPAHQPVVVLGSSHTAIDALFCLTQAQPERPVILLSRHGLLPHSHRPHTAAPQWSELPDYLQAVPRTVRALMRAVRKAVNQAYMMGVNWRDVLNALRPHTPALWQELPLTEQQRFTRHVQAYWDVHHHRLAPLAAQRLQGLLQSGQVRVIAGRIHTARSGPDGVQLQVQPRGGGALQQLSASALVNCTGPSTQLPRCQHPLVQQGLQQGWLQPDGLGLGIRVAAGYQLLGREGQAIAGQWYIGPWLRAQHWEATAVPELRVHAQQLAQAISQEVAAARGKTLVAVA